MAYYFIASITVTDQLEYRKYLDRADDVFSAYNGTYLAVDTSPELLEGNWDSERAVLIRFDTRGDFEAWYMSDEYQEILRYRLRASRSNSILVKGKP